MIDAIGTESNQALFKDNEKTGTVFIQIKC